MDVTPKRSKELSKQDKDGNPIWLKPERSKELEYDSLSEILLQFAGFASVAWDKDGVFKSTEVRDEYKRVRLAIEKWAKEKYGKR